MLLHTSRTTIRRALRETRQLLDEHGTTIEPAPAPSTAVVNLLAVAGRAASTAKIKPAS